MRSLPAHWILVLAGLGWFTTLSLSGASLIVSILTFVVLSGVPAFWFFRKSQKQKQFQEIRFNTLKELISGKKGARIPSFENDEARDLSLAINVWIDSWEKSTTQNISQSQSQSKWLQEIIHDLRTPLATLAVQRVTLSEGEGKLSTAQRIEILGDMQNEITYLETLAEDMLFIGLMNDASYFSRTDQLSIPEALLPLFDQFQRKAEKVGKKFIFENLLNSSSSMVLEGNFKLLERLIRNCVENAIHFADKEIRVSVAESNNAQFSLIKNNAQSSQSRSCVITVGNDGAPLSDEQIRQFGVDREARKPDRSFGLGSVIMGRCVAALGGKLQVGNRAQGGHFHPQITIILPTHR